MILGNLNKLNFHFEELIRHLPLSINSRSVVVQNKLILYNNAIKEIDFLRKILIENDFVLISGFNNEVDNTKMKNNKNQREFLCNYSISNRLFNKKGCDNGRCNKVGCSACTSNQMSVKKNMDFDFQHNKINKCSYDVCYEDKRNIDTCNFNSIRPNSFRNSSGFRY